ncbi:MAG: flagellar basal body rod protein FlgB [Deltaproteobacteria bacterium]|nr:flagellar basal body rod protein FlgB [Deltaproteobacteria bacterium]MBW1718871.1 flagellar basal body rod protein FlgB [Deltaproteobacteria bacterium]MBW1938192.1 flagellar basal body rod protein FlgB [Deltaproteobacteria bacterium]
MDILFNKTIEMLSTILDFRSERNKMIASNIANIDTPRYKPKELVFKKQLEDFIDNGTEVTMTKTDKRHLSKQSSHNFEVINSEEAVKIDNEMEKLAENHLMYNLTVELMARKFKGLDSVLREAK